MNLNLKVEKIRDAIVQESDLKIASIRQSINDEISSKVAEGKKQIDLEFKKILEEEKARIQLFQKRNLSKAILSERNRKLHVQAELIEHAFQFVHQKLQGLRSQGDYYKNILKALIVEAVNFMKDDDHLILQMDEADREIINDDYLGSIEIIFTFNENRSVRFKISDKYIKTLGGVILTAEGKRLCCNNTIEERLEVEAPLIKRVIAEMLLKEGV